MVECPRLLLLGVLCTASACVFLLSRGRTSSFQRGQPDCSTDAVSGFRACLLEALRKHRTKRWSAFPPAVRACADPIFRTKSYFNQDDVKVVLPLLPLHNDSACTLVTLGIGGDVGAELKFKTDYPRCRFVGADPTPANGMVYMTELGGRFVATAVGLATGQAEMSVLVGPGIFDYARRNVSTKEFIAFLNEDVRAALIDHLWVDNEGPEYAMFRRYVVGGALARSGHTICQLNAEFHGPLANYGESEDSFDALMEDIVRRSGFLPVTATDPQNHGRMMFFNFAAHKCVSKFVSAEPLTCK